jgi:hypothetical protein
MGIASNGYEAAVEGQAITARATNSVRRDQMNTGKRFLLAVTFVMLTGLYAGAMAQSETSAFRVPPEPVLPTAHVNAIEITDGTLGYDSQTKSETAFGYSFLGRTTGSFPGSLTLAMNCTPAIPIAGGTSELTGGVWTLPVYMTGIKSTGYAGSLYGTIAKGTMFWDKTRTNANVYIVLNVDGGTQSWDGVGGYATFTGTLFVDEKTQKTMLNGDLVFTTISVLTN